MSDELKIGFVGFGEAGYHIAKGLRSAGVTHVHDTRGRGEKIPQLAQETGVVLCDSNARLAAACDVLPETVTAGSALEAAQQNAPHLTERHIYADLNSVSPALQQAIAPLVTPRGARFVEAAIITGRSRRHLARRGR